MADDLAAANHNRFLEHLQSSDEAVWHVAKWLSSRGYSVSVPSSTKAKERGQWKQHADNGDLFIVQRVEVKRLRIDFTSRDDWPFSEFIVCARHAFDNANPKPYFYVILSHSMKHAALVKADSHRRWYTAVRTDSRYEGIAQEFYFARLDDVAFCAL